MSRGWGSSVVPVSTSLTSLVQGEAKSLGDGGGGSILTFRFPPVRVTLTKRRVYLRRLRARPLGTLGFSWASTCSRKTLLVTGSSSSVVVIIVVATARLKKIDSVVAGGFVP